MVMCMYQVIYTSKSPLYSTFNMKGVCHVVLCSSFNASFYVVLSYFFIRLPPSPSPITPPVRYTDSLSLSDLEGSSIEDINTQVVSIHNHTSSYHILPRTHQPVLSS